MASCLLRSSIMAELTVIGCRAGSPGACGPASGYVLRLDHLTLLIDCGPGVVAGLAERALIGDLDGVLVSHAHADHCADLVALAYHRSFPRSCAPLPLFGPPSLASVIAKMDDTFGIPSLAELAAPIATALPFTPMEANAGNDVLGERVETFTMNHPVETFAFRFPAADFTYTADGSLSDPLVRFTRGSRVLIAHGHMTATTAGRLASGAGAETLVVTHFSDCGERESTRAAAASVFGGPTYAACPGLKVALG
jgi:ribonuclease BN (tRNA processing enzyme)